MDNTLLLSPSLTLDFRSPDLHPQESLASSPTSPLMLSPLSPSQSPRISFNPITRPHLYPGGFIESLSTFNAQHSPDTLSPGPGSVSSSDDSRSPVDNPPDVDFDNMTDFEYSYPFSFNGAAGAAYGGADAYHSSQMMSNRKPHPIEIPSADGEGIPVTSPYGLSSADLPFIGAHVKQEHYHSNGSDATAYNYMTPEHISAQSYAYTSSPESTFLDGAAYYSPPGSLPTSASIPISAHPQHSTYALSPHTGHTGQGAAGAGQGGCDPRFVSASPPDLDFRSRIISGSGPSPSPTRFAGAFGSAGADADADAEGEVEGDDLREYAFGNQDGSGEEERTDEDGDSDYVDGNGRRRLRTRAPPLVVPSQAARVTALTTPVVGSSFTSPLSQAVRDVSRSMVRMQRPSAPAPSPVPNLTKKSRGRRVPTNPGIVVTPDGSARRTRGYTCRVAGCGKCFARGEHLKRHIRSIHTNEKPHKCSHPGCGKEFSRHDNLCQHMRVHRNYSAPRDGGLPQV
ncbi:hypothetical protein ACEPAI_130 [Sanghuangporus weigelae]